MGNNESNSIFIKNNLFHVKNIVKLGTFIDL